MVEARTGRALLASACALCGAMRTVRYRGRHLVHFAVVAPLPLERYQECLYCGRRSGVLEMTGGWRSPLLPPRGQLPAVPAGPLRRQGVSRPDVP